MEASNATLYGQGVFSTIAIFDGKPFLWEKHWRRMIENASKIGLDLSDHSSETVRSAVDDSVSKNGMVDGRARIMFLDHQPTASWPGMEPEQATSVHILVGEARPVPSQFRLTMSPYPVNSRSPLAGVKSSNYLENILAINEAKGRGFHEAVRVNERGYVTSGCMANVFWLKDERLYTPALSTGCLPGTTRDYVLENIEGDEVEIELSYLSDADAIFMTSAGLGICQVHEFDGRKLNVLDSKLSDLWPPTN